MRRHVPANLFARTCPITDRGHRNMGAWLAKDYTGERRPTIDSAGFPWCIAWQLRAQKFRRATIIAMTEDQFEKLARLLHETHEDLVERIEHVETTLGARIDTLTDRTIAVESKVDGIIHRLDTDAMQRTEQTLPGRIEAIEKHLGIVRTIAA